MVSGDVLVRNLANRGRNVVVYLISGNGMAAGKTTLAHKLVGESSTYALADVMRHELRKLYPSYDWFNKSQDYKDSTQVVELSEVDEKRGVQAPTVREVLIKYGQDKCREDPAYWAKKLVAYLCTQIVGKSVIAIDDVRKICELETLKKAFPNSHHFHVFYSNATPERIYDNEALQRMSDYSVIRHK